MSRKTISVSIKAAGNNSRFFLTQDLLEKLQDQPADSNEISGKMDEKKDAEKFMQIRQKLTDSLRLADIGVDSDFNLERWLIACNNDLSKVVKKLGKNLVYRKALKKNGISSNSDTTGEELENQILEKFCPSCDFSLFTQNDDRRVLVQILQLGNIDFFGVLHTVPSSVFIRSRLNYLESCFKALIQLELETGKRSGITWILDLDGLKFDQWTFAFVNGPFKTICELARNHYVEITKRIIILNSGKVLRSAWKALKPLIPPKTSHKITVLGSDWRHHLANFVDLDDIPKYYSGNLTANKSLLHFPDVVPKESYYKPTLSEPPDVMLQSKLLSRRGFFVEDFYISEPGSNLQWFFKCEGEISFGIFYSLSQQNVSELKKVMGNLGAQAQTPVQMVSPLLNLWPMYIPETGILSCDKFGWYYLVFMNPSFLVSKTLKHQLKQIVPGTLQLQMRVDSGEEASLY